MTITSASQQAAYYSSHPRWRMAPAMFFTPGLSPAAMPLQGAAVLVRQQQPYHPQIRFAQQFFTAAARQSATPLQGATAITKPQQQHHPKPVFRRQEFFTATAAAKPLQAAATIGYREWPRHPRVLFVQQSFTPASQSSVFVQYATLTEGGSVSVDAGIGELYLDSPNVTDTFDDFTIELPQPPTKVWTVRSSRPIATLTFDTTAPDGSQVYVGGIPGSSVSGFGPGTPYGVSYTNNIWHIDPGSFV